MISEWGTVKLYLKDGQKIILLIETPFTFQYAYKKYVYQFFYVHLLYQNDYILARSSGVFFGIVSTQRINLKWY